MDSMLLQFSTVRQSGTCGRFLAVNIPEGTQDESGRVLQQWFSEHSPWSSIHESWNLIKAEILRTHLDLLN